MIKIIDDFLNNKDLKIIQNFALYKAFYKPEFFEKTTEKTKENFYGNRWHLNNEPKILNILKNQAENKFNIKIKKIDSNSGIDCRNLDHFKPHIDSSIAKINILIMISGPTAVTNGTVFYHGDLNNYDLDIHVGFRENRAVMFPSNKIHSQHASVVPNLKRYTSTLFVEDYEE